MKTKKLIFLIFIVVALVQLFVPAKMILDREDIIETGKEFKFETAPVDPNDPFRGKYINLNFKENKFKINDENDWSRNQEVFVVLKNNKEGYATITTVLEEKPETETDYIKAKVKFINSNISDSYIEIAYPFERFYMEESKAKGAEEAYSNTFQNKKETTFALVVIKNGEAVLKDVIIGKKSIKDIVKEARNNN